MGSVVGSESPFGFGEETTWGVPVVPTYWPDLRGEGMKVEPEFTSSPAMRPGTPGSRSVALGSRRIETSRTASGDFTQDVLTRGMGLILKHLMGSTPGSTLATQRQGATAAYLHTFKLGPTDGKSFTLQKLLRDGQQNLIMALTYPGSKFTSGEFSLADGLLQLALEVSSKDELYTFEEGEPSYIEGGRNFTGMTASLKLGGNLLSNLVTDPKIKIENALKTEGSYLGSGGLISDQAQNGPATLTGEFTVEVRDRATFYEAWRNGTALAYELYFPGAIIDGAIREYIKFVLPEIQLLGDTPVVGSPETVTVPVSWQAFADDLGTAPFTIEYMTKDAVIG